MSNQPKDVLSELHGLRGIAVLLVVIGHGPVLPFDIPHIGRNGVSLFFVLSAFLLSRGLMQSGISITSITKYFFSRFFRIYPLFIALLLFEMFIGFDFKTRIGLEEVVKNLLLVEGYHIYWTIVVEFQFYLILPIILMVYILIDRILKRVFRISDNLLSLQLFLCFLTLLAVLVYINSFVLILPYPLVTGVYQYLPIFLFGTGLGVWTARFGIPEPSIVFVVIGIAGVCIFQWILMRLTLGQPVPELFSMIPDHRYFTFIGLSWGCVLIGAFNKHAKIILQSKILVFIGIISYSVYLFHMPINSFNYLFVFPFLSEYLGGFYSFGVRSITLIAPMILATISYFLIEQTFSRFGKRLSIPVASYLQLIVSKLVHNLKLTVKS